MPSEGERRYVREGVAQNVRSDGRSRRDYRHFRITVGTMPQCHGSAEIRADDAVVVAGVRVALETPDPTAPDEGKIVANVQFSGNSNSSSMITNSLNETIRVACASTNANKDLCPAIGKRCWVAYADVVVLDDPERRTTSTSSSASLCAHEMSDMIALVTYAALKHTRFPRLTFDEEDGDVLGVDADAPPRSLPEAFLDAMPVRVTLAKIHRHFVVDASALEMACSDVEIVVAANSRGNLCAIEKSSAGDLSLDELLDGLKEAQAVALVLMRRVSDALKTTKDGAGLLSTSE